MSVTVSASLLLTLCGMAAGLTRQYFRIQERKNWYGAQEYCRKNFKDLATITTETENSMIKNSDNSYIEGWIGLKWSAGGSWSWSDGETSSFFKQQMVPAWSMESCVKVSSYGLYVDYSLSENQFLCYRSFILVKLNKTWEDALQYCREHYTGLAYALSVQNPGVIQNEAAEVQTASVWTGLRFMDGKWFWVNFKTLQIPDELPECPAQNYRCGARNIKTKAWESQDCNKKLNFICYWGGIHL